MGLGFPLTLWWNRASLPNATWHCSSCFSTISHFLNKMSSFSHVPLNVEMYRDRERVVVRVKNGKDLWDREGETFVKVGGE